ncbi:MAG TPA: cadherin domain-containing protein, partial [Geobacteraceae bacterium]|nr:cadherin domain-containing protein [Geobacteraceae bacterium]
FQIDATTGALTFVSAPNFEAPADAGANNVYDVQVTVTDTAGLTDVQAFAVTVTDVNEAPTITAPNSGNAVTMNVAENSTAVADVNAADVDAGQTITYSLSGTDAALFSIDASTGVVAFATPPDYEAPADSGADNLYNFTVNATDNGTGNLTDTQAFAVTVTDVNEAPVITAPNSGNAVALSYAENGTGNVTDVDATDPDAGQTVTYSLSGADANLFSIDTNGVVTWNSSPNYEAPLDAGADNIYNVTVTATDNGTGNLTDTQDFAVTVTDVYDTVVVEQNGAWIDLNANGVRDAADTIAADFTPGSGNVDLANNPVTIHFNDAPNTSINLTGFTSDDKIEVDVNSFNGHLMPSTPAHSLNSYFNSVPSRLFLHMDNSGSFGLFSATPFSGLAFNRGGTAVLAYWTDNPGNPLLDINNIMPGVVTSGGVIVSGGSAALSALNQGAGHGILIDFLWPTPQTLQVVVDGTGAYLDANANGIVDAGELRTNMGGDVDMSFNHVTVHFNDVPNGALNLSGFGADDLIEIDAQAFIDNGHNALQILT